MLSSEFYRLEFETKEMRGGKEVVKDIKFAFMYSEKVM